MSSYRKLAIAIRNEGGIYSNPERNRFLPAVLEIAHALSRGRKPTSCSVLPGVNLQTWLRHTFVEITDGCRDFMSKECSIADDVADRLYGWGYHDPDTPAILRAITMCSGLLKPLRKEADCRGDFWYQDAHRVTNLKKKRAWLRNKNGSQYDDIHDDYDPVEEYDLNIDMDHMPNKVESSNDADATLETAISPDALEPPLVPRVRRIRHVSS